MRDTNRKFLVIAVALMAVAMLAVPVMADPTQGQKAAITIYWTGGGATYVSDFTGNVEHRHAVGNWIIVLEIDGGPTYTGTAVNTVREVLIVPQKDGNNVVFREYLEMWFPSAGGGFEGNIMVLMDGVGNLPELRSKAHGLLQGYGAFEGQTINAGHHWVPPGPIVWTGYLLKP